MVLLVQAVVDHMLLIRPACCAFRKVVLWPVALVERAKLPDPQGGSVDEDLPDALDLWFLKPAGSPEEAVRLDVGDYVLCACPVMINASIVQERPVMINASIVVFSFLQAGHVQQCRCRLLTTTHR